MQQSYFIIIKNKTYSVDKKTAVGMSRLLLKDINLEHTNIPIRVNNSKYILGDVSGVVLFDLVVTRRQIINKSTSNHHDLVNEIENIKTYGNKKNV